MIEIEGNTKLIIEIKSGATFSKDYLKGIEHFSKVAGEVSLKKVVVYAGEHEQVIHDDIVLYNENNLLKDLARIIS